MDQPNIFSFDQDNLETRASSASLPKIKKIGKGIFAFPSAFLNEIRAYDPDIPYIAYSSFLNVAAATADAYFFSSYPLGNAANLIFPAAHIGINTFSLFLEYAKDLGQHLKKI